MNHFELSQQLESIAQNEKWEQDDIFIEYYGEPIIHFFVDNMGVETLTTCTWIEWAKDSPFAFMFVLTEEYTATVYGIEGTLTGWNVDYFD